MDKRNINDNVTENEMVLAPQWIYGNPVCSHDHEELFKSIEEALGFKLFVWQKSYILYKTYMHSGKSTAEILRQLINPAYSKSPVGVPRMPISDYDREFYGNLVEIKKKLDEKGIATRETRFV